MGTIADKLNYTWTWKTKLVSKLNDKLRIIRQSLFTNTSKLEDLVYSIDKLHYVGTMNKPTGYILISGLCPPSIIFISANGKSYQFTGVMPLLWTVSVDDSNTYITIGGFPSTGSLLGIQFIHKEYGNTITPVVSSRIFAVNTTGRNFEIKITKSYWDRIPFGTGFQVLPLYSGTIDVAKDQIITVVKYPLPTDSY